MSITQSATKGIPVTLQSVATSGNGTTIAIPTPFRNHKLIVKGSGTIGAGAIQPETADSPTYSSTWAPVGGGPVDITGLSGGGEYSIDFIGIYQFIRARISTDVTGGGSVTVTYVGS